MHYDLVPTKVQVRASQGYLRQVILLQVLLYHLDPEEALVKTGQCDHPLTKVLGLIGLYSILPSDHDVLIDTKLY